ncbi:MAG TPA: DUF305 domain-containing protein [Pseudonocardiaceae bacterium]|nr:DUF305 domain-containing protein [Pseudonocardiaceae bacterium]
MQAVSAETADNSGQPPAGGASNPRWLRVALAVGAALAMLLLGAAAGLMIRPTGSDADHTAVAGSVDVGFAQDMSDHHRQAVQMAAWERERTADPVLRQLAFDIESSQTEQIGRMQGWLTLWGQSPQAVDGHMRWMTGPADPSMTGMGGMPQTATMAKDGGRRMPGMATDEELRRLRSLSGRELDVYFLQVLIRHHQGGVPMLRYATEHASQNAVRALASGMLTAQTAETDYMQALLTERGAQPLPA